MDLSHVSIDRSQAIAVERPATVEALGGLVARARQSRLGIYPVGGRTTLDVGMPPLKLGLAINTTGLDRVIDYPARDMTITVQAGITVAQLQAKLAAEGQWLPIDVAQPQQATLGGAIALNQSGPHRYGYGTLRDYVIGISFVTDEGVEVKAGGRVVKNVAGYDLMKLQIGAVGTLGIVTQATLKVKPRPECRRVIVFGCTDANLDDVLNRLHASHSRPAFIELLNEASWRSLASSSTDTRGFDWLFAVGLEEKTVTVAWQLATLLKELRDVITEPTELSSGESLVGELTDLQTRPQSPLIEKLSVKPSELAQSVRAIANADRQSLIHAHALNGIIWWHPREASSSHPRSVRRRCPPEIKAQRSIWGEPTADWELMRHIKQTLDPENLFNPGRLFGDL